MAEIFENFHLIFWGAIVLICVVPTLAHYWAKVRQTEVEASLKREMIERGMSAEEICSVLEAGSKTTSRKSVRRDCKDDVGAG